MSPPLSLFAAGAALAAALTQNAHRSSLLRIDLSYSGTGDATAAAFGILLAAQGGSATDAAETAAPLAGGGLRDLLLRGNSVGQASADALAQGIRSAGPQLRSVDLSYSQGCKRGTAAHGVLRAAADAWNERHSRWERAPVASSALEAEDEDDRSYSIVGWGLGEAGPDNSGGGGNGAWQWLKLLLRLPED